MEKERKEKERKMIVYVGNFITVLHDNACLELDSWGRL
jgi:hypothetical protein